MKTGLLFSGGMDSLALAWWKRPDTAFTLNYGQLAAEAEIAAATAVCRRLGIEQHVINIDCRSLGSGDMAGSSADALAPESDWWPYRNQMLITLAAMKAIGVGVTELWLGTVSSDGSHKDGTPAFVEAMNILMSLQEGSIKILAPAITLSTEELVRQSGVPADLLAWAHSCHTANVPCGRCRGCNKYFAVLDKVGHDLDRTR